MRQDHGARYLQWDLPQEISREIDKLYAVSSFEDLKMNLDIAEKMFWQTVESYQFS
jgi:hypothetical protein